MASGGLRPPSSPSSSAPSARRRGAFALGRPGAPAGRRAAPGGGRPAAHDLRIVSLALDRLRAWIDADLRGSRVGEPGALDASRSPPRGASRRAARAEASGLPAAPRSVRGGLEARSRPAALRAHAPAGGGVLRGRRRLRHRLHVAVALEGARWTSSSSTRRSSAQIQGAGAVVVGAAVRLVHELGMVVVAEGVEDASQARFLEEAGADCSEGYLLLAPARRRSLRGSFATGGAERALCLERGAPNRHDPQECGNG
ncbi:EAL domain-containing protein [Eggerthella lenta]|uniref:EAL domain-containing protein n=1 Tax=Eggerthella lenta TaxID=84112 RepID=UPI003B58A9B5